MCADGGSKLGTLCVVQEDELRASSAKNVQLAQTVADLERRLKDFDKVSAFCHVSLLTSMLARLRVT